MNVIKQENKFGLKIFFKEDEKHFAITFGGNGDLYWSIHSKSADDKHNIIITKENFDVYRLFEQLFNDIENINIFEEDNSFIDKEKYRLFNCSNYSELYDKSNNEITWYSDETTHDVANFLKIKKKKIHLY